MTGRRAFLGCIGLLVAGLFLFGGYLLVVIASPYTSKAVPTYCRDAVSHIPPTARYDIPGLGAGVLLTEDSTTAVAITANYGQTPFVVDVYIVNKNRQAVIRHLSFNSDVLAAAIHSGTVYLFANNAIGYWTDADTGRAINYLIESDNYREVLTSGVPDTCRQTL